MKGSVNAADLAAAVKTAQSTIFAGTKLDALRHVRLTAGAGVLEIEATNLDQHMTVRLDANLSDGLAIVDPARLLMALQPISGEATISCIDGHMSVSGKGARSRLALLPATSWQGVEMPAAEASFDVKPESFLNALTTVLPAASTDGSVYYLAGVHLRWDGPDFIAEACDRFVILAKEIEARKPTAWPGSVIVPREFILAAGKLLAGDSATLSVTENRIVLTTPAGVLASKLIAATYPELDRVWDKKAAPVLRADRKSLLAVVKLAHHFSESDGEKLRSLVIHEGEVIAMGANGEKFQAAFECEYIKARDYAFQPKLLMTAISALASETVELTDGGMQPTTVVIHGDGLRTCAAVQRDFPTWWLREQAAAKREAA
jgi:DNA polymerase III sliding clamp (beta) subunit (PCNA family)